MLYLIGGGFSKLASFLGLSVRFVELYSLVFSIGNERYVSRIRMMFY